jgi:peptide chain release factor 1
MPGEEEMEIQERDLRIDSILSAGPGEHGALSAVRITHLPTNLVVSCSTEADYRANRAKAMEMLRSKLNERGPSRDD